MANDFGRAFAVAKHEECGCMYGEHPYSFHIEMVSEIGEKFNDELTYHERDIARYVCNLHDIIEDCRATYSDVKKWFNEEIAEGVYAVTNELGKNRKQRAERTYPKIAKSRVARFVKCCDRLANTTHSKNFDDNSMYLKYCKEYPDFRKALRIEGEFETLWGVLDIAHGFVSNTDKED